MINDYLQEFSKDELIKLIEIYSKNWLAMDGVWFQSVEKQFGMDVAMEHDCAIWQIFTKLEAMKIKNFLQLPESPGLEGLEKALRLRLYANINKDDITIDGNELIYRTLQCRVQHARQSKGMELHPCRPVGIIEYSQFAKVIDERINCQCVSCYPKLTRTDCNCAWRFWIEE